MSCLDFPSEGLIPNVTTFVVGDVTYVWTGVVWETEVSIPPIGGQDYIDIRDYGAIAGDPIFDNGQIILAAIADAGQHKTVMIYGGPFYSNNFAINSECKLAGGGTICPMSTALDNLPLIEVSASNCNISNLKFDSLNSGVYPLLVTGDNN